MTFKSIFFCFFWLFKTALHIVCLTHIFLDVYLQFTYRLHLQLIANQIVVNNQNLAQQIASGKVQVATINGQQVLIRPTGNNQAQVVAQLTPSSIQSTQLQAQIASPQATTVNVAPAKQTVIQAQQDDVGVAKVTQDTSGQLDKNTIDQLLVGQPPGTVIKCVTAQVIQTQQGPRIVLQGLQGADFTPQQLAAVQQQVKQQLLKGRGFLFMIMWNCEIYVFCTFLHVFKHTNILMSAVTNLIKEVDVIKQSSNNCYPKLITSRSYTSTVKVILNTFALWKNKNYLEHPSF